MTDSLERRLVARKTDERVFRPVRFVLTDPADRAALSDLLASDDPPEVIDTYEAQLAELVETRSVARKQTADERAAAVTRMLAGRDPKTLGIWFFYPWARRLVHLLGHDEFDELRLSRNRNKITEEEQRKLRGLDVVVIGLSVGRATAVTLVLEGVVGRIRLADFDVLELSNLNRIRDTVFGLGLSKAVLAAREIAEIDPFVDVEIHPAGVAPDTIHAILTQPRPVDVIIEECDDLEMKVRIRECARDLGIPVVMETSDRGMLDVERFDLEPGREIFHGLVGDLRAADLRGLDTYRKVPHVLRIIGAATMSKRMAASLVDVETTLKTWPQLASAVALGGALNTEAVRRIGLGGLTRSGRYYADLDDVLAAPSDAAALDEAPAAVADATVLACPEPPEDGAQWHAWARFLVAHAALAPSGGNSQPWRFFATPGEIRCLVDADRWPTLLDYDGRASLLACGAAAKNLALAAMAAGRRWSVEWGDATGDVVWIARDGAEVSPDPSVLAALRQRATNRHLGRREPLTPAEIAELRRDDDGVEIAVRHDDAALAELGEILAAGDRIRMLHPRMHRELMGELRWTTDEAIATADGIDLATLELDATQRAAIGLSREWGLMSTLREIGGGRGLGRGSRLAAARAAGFALVRSSSVGRVAFLRGGAGILSLWLRAEGLGLGVQPMTAILYLFDRVAGGGAGLDRNEVAELNDLHRRIGALFGESPGTDLMLLRLARTPPPSARSVRRSLDKILDL